VLRDCGEFARQVFLIVDQHVRNAINEALQLSAAECLPSSTNMPEQMKTETILELPAPCKRAAAARDLLVAYVSNSGSLAERLDFEIHCLVCDECRTTLAIIQDLLSSPVSDKEENTKTLALSSVGWEAAEIAWLPLRAQVPTSDSGGRLREAA
jgi:hypothetical protein